MKVEKQKLEDIITNKMGEYSTYVLLSRAIPDIRDGLKPSYRRILWAMKEMGATKLTKSANVEGKVMEYHPHGSTYQTIVGMTQTDAQLNPYLIGKGNFGMHASELAYGSQRYTEVKLSDISLDMMADSNKKGIEMIKNYDNTKDIPEVFPVKFPSILAYAQSGIGVGFSSSIPSFNINELNLATIKYIEKNEKTMLIPDFGTKAYVVKDDSVIKSINNNGKGSIVQRAKAKIEGNEIIVTEIPYDTTKEKIINRIIKLHKEGKLNEVRNIDDLSGLSGMEFIITAKKGTDMEMFLEKLYRMTPMEASYSSNMMVIDRSGLPKLMGVWDIIDEWVQWRREVITNMLTHSSKQKKVQLEILKGLENIKDDLNKVIDIIRKSTDDNVIQNLMKEFELTKLQANRISELKLRNLTTTFIQGRIKQIKDLEKEIKEIEGAIKSDKKKDSMIVDDLKEIIKKFGKERQSEVILKEDIKNVVIDVKEEIDDYNIKLFITEEGYLKKVPLTSLRGNFNMRVKDGDKIVNEIEITNDSEILVFTDKNNVYKYKSYEIENHQPSELGEFMPTLLGLKDENILFITATKNHTENLLIGFDDGRMAKVSLKAYETKQNRSMLRNAYADKKAVFWAVLEDNADVDIMSISTIDKVVVSNTDRIGVKTSRTSQGNQVMKLKDGDSVVSYHIIDKDEYPESDYYVISGAGVGKYLKKGDFKSLLK